MLGALVAVASVASFVLARAATEGPDHADLQVVAASSASTVTARLDGDGRLLTAASEAIGGDPSLPDGQLTARLSRVATGGEVVGIVRTSSSAAEVISVAVPQQAATTVVGLDLGATPKFRLLLDIARDSGAAQVAADVVSDGHAIVIEVRPLYGSAGAPADVASRRGALVGYVVLLPPASARLGLASPTSGTGVVVRVVDGQTMLATSGLEVAGSAPSSIVSVPISTNGAGWTVEVWSTDNGSTVPWVVLGIGLLVALAVAALASRREESINRAVADAEARAQELALVARAGPLLQQSLALSDLFPVFSVEISDELELESISISLVSDAGRLVRVFSLGSDASPFDADPSSLEMPSGRVEPDEVITVPLLRSGRVVGALRARATSGLSAPQIDTLIAVCNLLAAALGNARLFQHEQEMVSRLRDVDRMKTTFVSSVSHELRTTVTAIEGFAGLLDGDTSKLDDTRRSDYIERIRRNARSLGVLVEDLLDFARFERSGIEVATTPIDLSRLVPDVVDQMSSLLGSHSVSTSIAPDVIAMGDLSAVERILVNLLSNAAKYTPPDTAIDVALERDDSHAVLTVADHGPGVPEDEREKVFELFYRVDDQSARATRASGSGWRWLDS